MSSFSILTACYNNKQFLNEYFDSVLCQGSDVEVVFVDDCSTDGSWEFANQYKSDPRVILVRNEERLYCSSSYKVALSHATSPLCGVVDADDALANKAVKRIKKLYSTLPDIGYIYTQHWWCDKDLKVKRSGLSSFPRKKSFAQLAPAKHCFSHWRTFRRDIVLGYDIFPDGLKYAVDKHLGFALQHIARGAFYPKELYYYRYYKGNMSLVYPKEQKMLWTAMAEKYSRMTTHPVIKIKV